MESLGIDAFSILPRQLGFSSVLSSTWPRRQARSPLCLRMGTISQRSQRRSYFHRCHPCVEQVAPLPQAPSGGQGTACRRPRNANPRLAAHSN